MSLERQMQRLSAYLADKEVHTTEGLLADCIIDDSPLGFERGANEKQNVEEDLLEEINLGTEAHKRPIFVSAFLLEDYKERLVNLITKYKDCFA